METDIFVFTLILAFFLILGVKDAFKIKTESLYLLADRKTKLFPLVATLVMTEFNPSTLLAFSSVGYIAGVWGLSMPFVFLIGLLFYTLVVASKWKRLNASSVAELFTLRYGVLFGKSASFLLLVALLGFSANYIKSLQLIFSPLVENFSGVTVSLIIVLLIGFITLRGGLVSIIRTDMGSFIATLIFIPLLYYFSIPNSKISEISVEMGMNVLPPEFILSLIILTMFTYISAPWYGQKIFSADSEKTAFLAVGISSILVFVLYGIPILAVYNLKLANIELKQGEMAIPFIIKNMFPPGIRGFSYGILFLAGATTLSGVWSSMTTMIVSDFLPDHQKESKTPGRSMLITFLLMAVSFAISEIFIDRILDKMILANIPIAAISFGLLTAFYWKGVSRVGLVASIGFGIGWGIFCYLYFGEKGGYTIYWAIYGVPLLFLIGIIFSYIFSAGDDEKELSSEFYKRMSKEE